MSRTTRRALVVSLAAAGLVPLTNGTAHASTLAAVVPTAPVYTVVQEGLTAEQAEKLARTAGIGNALRPDGSFSFTDPRRFARVPGTAVERGKDEDGRATVSEAVDFTALARTKALPDDEALKLAKNLLPVPDGYGARPVVDHTTLDQSDTRGTLLRSYNLDTTVSYQLTLGDVPVVGPGAKVRASFAGDGSVVQLGQAVRQIKRSGEVPIVSPARAQETCTQLYGARTKQDTPVLGYYAPALGATDANGQGAVAQLLPHYICRPVDGVSETSSYGGKLVPASPATAPTVQLKASGDGRTVSASAGVKGGTGPYAYSWSSSSVPLDLPKAQIQYVGQNRYDPRDPQKTFTETLTVTVTDTNGLATTAKVDLVNLQGDASSSGVQGGVGGTLASNGIEQTVDEWQCAQDSADGYKSVMQSKGHSVAFDWRGPLAWEKDFKDKNQGGLDASYADKVDAQWYTGHGWSGGFTFKGAHDDGNITPNEARWGDDNLEWLQLESCQVLRDTNGKKDYFGRWGQAFQGLHLLNGFDTNAQCLNGGTGRRFASYLFPEKLGWWTTRDALTVQQAWGTMAADLEPAGTRWRSMSPATYKVATGQWVTNLGDYYWGQGSVGPDIRPGSTINPLQGFFSVSGVS
ncbi:hypothetical protein GCM10022223_03350 [Kineosporia mesophila]|uniref:Uncharacterized protein n=1 Tax=Kineosporia mesophila TaxID=566012 RepID=A0ABP6YYY6_9ACTN|nr:DUF6345 domain-containing protein [Kineosporia mesophila]MCD5351819.1 DUF6345 domain-containing protein [Kineosporia mesophila]